jgi:hypothetical protein
LEFGELLIARWRMMMRSPYDAPQNSLKDSNANLKKKKTTEKKS